MPRWPRIFAFSLVEGAAASYAVGARVGMFIRSRVGGDEVSAWKDVLASVSPRFRVKGTAVFRDTSFFEQDRAREVETLEWSLAFGELDRSLANWLTVIDGSRRLEHLAIELHYDSSTVIDAKYQPTYGSVDNASEVSRVPTVRLSYSWRWRGTRDANATATAAIVIALAATVVLGYVALQDNIVEATALDQSLLTQQDVCEQKSNANRNVSDTDIRDSDCGVTGIARDVASHCAIQQEQIANTADSYQQLRRR